MRASLRYAATVTCGLCGRTVPRTVVGQRYCNPCAARRGDPVKRPRSHPDIAAANRSAGEKEAFARGEEISQAARRGLAWAVDLEPRLRREIGFALPYSGHYSKNGIFAFTKDAQHIALRKEAKSIKNAVAMSAKLSLRGERFFEGKVWIDILVQKPHHKSDAVNVVDLICDGLKVGIGVDDRWFSIRRLDWEIVKEHPMIYIGAGQDIVEDHRACSYCGQVRPHRHFRSARRMCNDCHGSGILIDPVLENGAGDD